MKRLTTAAIVAAVSMPFAGQAWATAPERLSAAQLDAVVAGTAPDHDRHHGSKKDRNRNDAKFDRGDKRATASPTTATSTSPSFVARGAEIAAFSGGVAGSSDAAGATVTFTFTGTAVSWIGLNCNVCGIATVSIDGGAPVTVNTAGPAAPGSPGLASQAVFTTSGLGAGSHTMVITVAGTTTSGGAHVIVDAFDVTGTGGAATRFEESNPAIRTGTQHAKNDAKNGRGDKQDAKNDRGDKHHGKQDDGDKHHAKNDRGDKRHGKQDDGDKHHAKNDRGDRHHGKQDHGDKHHAKNDRGDKHHGKPDHGDKHHAKNDRAKFDHGQKHAKFDRGDRQAKPDHGNKHSRSDQGKSRGGTSILSGQVNVLNGNNAAVGVGILATGGIALRK